MKAGKLQCQQKDFHAVAVTDGCTYASGKNNEIRCAIGAVFTREQISELKKKGLNSQTRVSDLVGEKFIKCSKTDEDFFEALQAQHDKGINNLKEFIKPYLK